MVRQREVKVKRDTLILRPFCEANVYGTGMVKYVKLMMAH